LDNLISFKRFSAKAQRDMGEAKQTTWKAFISGLSRSTRSDVVWDRLRRMSGKYSRIIIPGLSAGGAFFSSQADIANTIVFSFTTVYISGNCNPDLGAIRNMAETLPLNLTPSGAESYDAIFTMDGLLTALDRCRNKFPGPDSIHNEMLSHLPLAGKKYQLSVYKSMWTEGLVPDAWKEAISIRVLKFGRDRLQAASYRRIGRTSCLCETVVLMVNRRLVWALESRNLISGAQCVFRHHRSAIGHFVNSEHHMQTRFCYASILSLFSSTWRRLTAPSDGIAFFETHTAGM
jgi:hypothetical protein